MIKLAIESRDVDIFWFRVLVSVVDAVALEVS